MVVLCMSSCQHRFPAFEPPFEPGTPLACESNTLIDFRRPSPGLHLGVTSSIERLPPVGRSESPSIATFSAPLVQLRCDLGGASRANRSQCRPPNHSRMSGSTPRAIAAHRPLCNLSEPIHRVCNAHTHTWTVELRWSLVCV